MGLACEIQLYFNLATHSFFIASYDESPTRVRHYSNVRGTARYVQSCRRRDHARSAYRDDATGQVPMQPPGVFDHALVCGDTRR